MSKVFRRGPATAEINMTPLIDITFQLIIFFLLTNSIASEELVPMVVPELQQSQARELGEEARVVVNLVPVQERQREDQPPLQTDGSVRLVKIGLREYSVNQLDQVTAELVEARTRNPQVQVVLRADGAIFYQNVAPIMNAITAAQIGTIKMVAYLAEE